MLHCDAGSSAGVIWRWENAILEIDRLEKHHFGTILVIGVALRHRFGIVLQSGTPFRRSKRLDDAVQTLF